ncbi:MAG TPA: HNH endonuclease [Alphaproteobacteria bacterium]|nr:HNH endonuclease [Alphaproteobacteria bacterium]
MQFFTSPEGPLHRAAMRRRLAEAQNHRCCHCGCRLTEPRGTRSGNRPTDATIEHALPRSAGGADDWLNLAVSCHACNAARGDRMLAL